jgi:hypothetical protein
LTGRGVERPAIAVTSKSSAGSLAIIGGVIVGGALLLSAPRLMQSGSNAEAAEPQLQTAPQEGDGQLQQCWVATDKDRGFGYLAPC